MELHLTRKDFRVDWFSGTGAGGQHRNKHQNCCRIVHNESGLVATGQSHRDRPANQREAFEKLARMVIAWYMPDAVKARRTGGETVRTYHEPRNTVVDHASGEQMLYREGVIRGNIAPLIEARRRSAAAGKE